MQERDCEQLPNKIRKVWGREHQLDRIETVGEATKRILQEDENNGFRGNRGFFGGEDPAKHLP